MKQEKIRRSENGLRADAGFFLRLGGRIKICHGCAVVLSAILLLPTFSLAHSVRASQMAEYMDGSKLPFYQMGTSNETSTR